jgi:hypothetical protein
MQQVLPILGKSTNGALKNTRRATVQSPDRKSYMEDGVGSVVNSKHVITKEGRQEGWSVERYNSRRYSILYRETSTSRRRERYKYF